MFTLPNCVGGNGFARFSFQSPLGFLLFQTRYERILTYTTRVSIPFEVFTLPNYAAAGDYKPARIRFQSPLRCLLFQTQEFFSEQFGTVRVSIPFEVFTLPNSISAIPVFMRAKLVVCGEESFFSSFSTEFSLKMSLSPVFMRCAVKFIFSFIAFIYYNGNFL